MGKPTPKPSALWASPLKLLWAAFVITTPFIGVWLASSLMAYRNGPVWAAVLAGLGLFPILPVAWDLFGTWLRNRGETKRKRDRDRKGLPYQPKARFLTWFDRLILRTLAVNMLFIGGLLASYPEQGFEALSTRGDWMLDGKSDETSEKLRQRLFWAAERIQWLYDWAHENPFRELGGDEPPPDGSADPEPAPIPTATPTTTTSDQPPSKGDEPAPKGDEPRAKTWPLAAEIHPAVTNLPADRETSIASVAEYLAAAEKDPYFLVKALHDYVADRVAYDAPAYVEGRYPPQDAETVFRTRTSVCAGYAQLLTALGKAAGVKIVYVVGDARSEGWDLSGEGHAWNAAEIEGQWYLLDATWNAGSVSGSTFSKRYKTEYLFTPPKAFGANHFPDDARWQLRSTPLTRGEFLRQPVLPPRFHAMGFELIQPNRSQVTVSGAVYIDLLNPRGMHVAATAAEKRGGPREDCTVSGTSEVRVQCTFPGEGRYDVQLFANEAEYGSYEFVGQLAVNNDT